MSFFPVHTVKLKDLTNIERTASNAVRLSGPSKIGLRTLVQTELLFSTEIIRSSSDSIIIQTRTTPYDDSTSYIRGIEFVVFKDSTTIRQGSSILKLYTPLPTGKPFLFEIHNDGAWFTAQIGHTTVGPLKSSLPNTEWVLVGIPATGTVLVGDPQFITL
jgi:hypothetical protein